MQSPLVKTNADNLVNAPGAPATPGRSVLHRVVLGAALAFVTVGVAFGGFYLLNRADPKPGAASGFGKYGGIEIGSTGVKSLVVEFIKSESYGYDFQQPLVETKNTKLSELPKESSEFDPAKLEATRDAVKEFYDAMRKQGVPPERIHVVASSGLFAGFKGDKDAITAARAVVTKTVMDATGLKPVFIDSTEEGTLAARAIIPRKETANSLLFDVGGGNTNGGYFDDKGQFHSLGLKYGTRSFYALAQDAQKKDQSSFAEAANKLRQSVLAEEVHALATREPSATDRKRVHLIGGIVWAMATYLHPAEQTDASAIRVHLVGGDFNRFAELVATKPEALRDQLAVGPNKEAIRKGVEEVQAVFNPDQLFAGAQILKALADEYHLRDKEKELVFFRTGQVAWMMGYLQHQAALDDK